MKTAWLNRSQTMELEESESLCGKVGQDEVLIKIKATTICASDTKHFKREKPLDGRPYHFQLGHEPSGIVWEVGSGVKDVKVGDRVTIEPQISCGHCDSCKRGFENMCENLHFLASKSYKGSLTEELIWPARLVHRIPDSMSYEVAAMFEPMSIAYMSFRNADFSVIDNAAILGAGAIGALARVLLHIIKPEVNVYFVDISQAKLDLCRNIGIPDTYYVNNSTEFTLPKVDLIIDTTGIGELVSSLYSYMNTGCYIGVIGFTDNPHPLSLNPKDIVYKGLTVHGSVRFRDTFKPLLEMIGDNPEYLEYLQKIITHHYPLEKVQDAFEKAAFDQDYLKIVVTCNDGLEA